MVLAQVYQAQMSMLGAICFFLLLMGWAQYDVIQPLLQVQHQAEAKDAAVAAAAAVHLPRQ